MVERLGSDRPLTPQSKQETEWTILVLKVGPTRAVDRRKAREHNDHYFNTSENSGKMDIFITKWAMPICRVYSLGI